MSTDTPDWLTAVQEADIAAQFQRDEAERIANQRAHAIAQGVEQAGRGGRDIVAAQLGVRVGAVDKAIARAKANPQYSHLPGNLLERLFDLELADLKPLTHDQWQAIAFLVRGTVIDFTWLHTPAELLAFEIEDAADGGDLAGAGVDCKELAATVRTWNRTQAIAVLEAIRQDAVDALPAIEDDPR